MIPVKKIHEAFVADIEANLKATLGLETIVAHDAEFNDKTLAELVPLAPAVLIRYRPLKPIESEREADGASGMVKQAFIFTFISQSLLGTQDANNGCYDMVDAFRERYNGGVLTVPGEGTIHLKLEDENDVQAGEGVSVYFEMFSFEQD